MLEPRAILYGVCREWSVGLPARIVSTVTHPNGWRTHHQGLGLHVVLPNARVAILPNANHFVFRSNQSEVIAEMRAFIDRLPP
jgi:hypothetical protein